MTFPAAEAEPPASSTSQDCWVPLVRKRGGGATERVRRRACSSSVSSRREGNFAGAGGRQPDRGVACSGLAHAPPAKRLSDWLRRTRKEDSGACAHARSQLANFLFPGGNPPADTCMRSRSGRRRGREKPGAAHARCAAPGLQRPQSLPALAPIRLRGRVALPLGRDRRRRRQRRQVSLGTRRERPRPLPPSLPRRLRLPRLLSVPRGRLAGRRCHLLQPPGQAAPQAGGFLRSLRRLPGQELLCKCGRPCSFLRPAAPRPTGTPSPHPPRCPALPCPVLRRERAGGGLAGREAVTGGGTGAGGLRRKQRLWLDGEGCEMVGRGELSGILFTSLIFQERSGWFSLPFPSQQPCEGGEAGRECGWPMVSRRKTD